MDDVISFGKYKEDTIAEIIDKDPDYLEWAIFNVEDFELDDEALNFLENALGHEPEPP
jgi:hypothetical protein